ncbi:MAG TPA: tRNA pseudouridine(38-40) synthase TruA [Capsulimonadaceae bacterium]|nr:tRNA pseudouridine(38-40) synthase TruA [Capsulimonadaceae bacterium]
MRNIKLTLEYDGTDFAGFQTQGKGERTVQTTLERAVSSLTGEEASVTVAGRTDAGVHARGQVVNFRTASSIPVDRIAIALNGILPRDISVRNAKEAGDKFHARFSARQRTYVYLIWTEPERSALWGRFALHEPRELNLPAMTQAANGLVGSRNFGAFANAGGEPGSTLVRDLRRLDIRTIKLGSMVGVVVTANAFLRAMVRNLVGALVTVGRGEMTIEELTAVSQAEDRTSNPCPTAPAHGLCLLRVDY